MPRAALTRPLSMRVPYAPDISRTANFQPANCQTRFGRWAVGTLGVDCVKILACEAGEQGRRPRGDGGICLGADDQPVVGVPAVSERAGRGGRPYGVVAVARGTIPSERRADSQR